LIVFWVLGVSPREAIEEGGPLVFPFVLLGELFVSIGGFCEL
jgi:hypothetical protein